MLRISKPRTYLTLLKAALLSSVLLIAGCSTYQNMTAYFNTYYNASHLFDDVEREIAKTPKKDTDTNYFAQYNLPKPTEEKLDKVIEKCSKLIQFYPNSAYTDVSLMMIGKSYVYKGEDESGLRKFSELLANFPESGHRLEAKLWSVKALYHMKREDQALTDAKSLFTEARQEGKDDILLETLLIQGQIFFGRGEYDQAAATYEPAVEVSGPDELRCLAQMRLALCEERLGDREKAAAAYGRVRKYSPDFPTEVRARLKEGVMYSKAGHFQRALDLFDDLRAEPLRNDDRALVELETANTFRRMGDTARAMQWYDVIDTLYPRTDGSARSYYERGRICEDDRADFASALKYYDKAARESQTADITPESQQRSAILTNYFALRSGYRNYDTLLVAAIHRDSVTKAGGDLFSSGLHADSTSQTKMEGRRALDAELFPDTLHASPAPAEMARNARPKLVDRGGGGHMELPSDDIDEEPHDRAGALVSLDVQPPPATPQRSTVAAPPSGGDERPGGPGGRAGRNEMMLRERRDELGKRDRPFAPRSKGDSLALAEDTLRSAGGRAQPQQASRASLAALSPDSLRSLLAQTMYELAGIFYLQMRLPDSSLLWYRRVVDGFPDSPLLPKAYYAMAELDRSRGDSAAVDSIHRIILDRYSGTEYARQVRKSRGLALTDALDDSADARYAEATALLDSGKSKAALAAYRQIVAAYPPMAAKAMYAVGWIFENKFARNDSAAHWYKRLMKEYPASVYAASVRAKVSVRDDPKSLSQFVKYKEIPLIKPQSVRPDKTAAGAGKDAAAGDEEEQESKNFRKGKNGQPDYEDNTIDDDEDQPEAPDPDEEDSGDNGDDGGNN